MPSNICVCRVLSCVLGPVDKPVWGRTYQPGPLQWWLRPLQMAVGMLELGAAEGRGRAGLQMRNAF